MGIFRFCRLSGSSFVVLGASTIATRSDVCVQASRFLVSPGELRGDSNSTACAPAVLGALRVDPGSSTGFSFLSPLSSCIGSAVAPGTSASAVCAYFMLGERGSSAYSSAAISEGGASVSRFLRRRKRKKIPTPIRAATGIPTPRPTPRAVLLDFLPASASAEGVDVAEVFALDAADAVEATASDVLADAELLDVANAVLEEDEDV